MTSKIDYRKVLLEIVMEDGNKLPVYCRINGYNFDEIVDGFNRHRSIARFDRFTDGELVIALINCQRNRGISIKDNKQYYMNILCNMVMEDGSKLPEYCKKHGYSFDEVVAGFFRQRSIARLNKYTDYELVDALITNQKSKKRGRNDADIMIGDLTLGEYAGKYNVLTVSLRNCLNREKKACPGKSNKVIADAFVMRQREKNIVLYYYDMSFEEIRDRFGIIIDKQFVRKEYKLRYEGREDIMFEDAINEIVDGIIGLGNKSLILEYKSSRRMQDGE